MAYYVYILELSNARFYTGITWNISKRVKEHNSGLSIATKAFLPVKLLYWERFEDKYLAAKREKEIKGWSRIKKMKLLNSLRRA